MTENRYDKRDIVRREAVMIADGIGSMKMAAYRVRDPETDEFSPLQFHFTYDNTVMAVMGERSAKLFANFINDTLGITPTVLTTERGPGELAETILDAARNGSP